MHTDDLKKLANSIFHASSEDEVHCLLAPSGRSRKPNNLRSWSRRTRCKAWIERERAKGREKLDLTWANCVRELGLLQ
jgi:hypothetical protein